METTAVSTDGPPEIVLTSIYAETDEESVMTLNSDDSNYTDSDEEDAEMPRFFARGYESDSSDESVVVDVTNEVAKRQVSEYVLDSDWRWDEEYSNNVTDDEDGCDTFKPPKLIKQDYHDNSSVDSAETPPTLAKPKIDDDASVHSSDGASYNET